jgi:hypothetical protein
VGEHGGNMGRGGHGGDTNRIYRSYHLLRLEMEDIRLLGMGGY